MNKENTKLIKCLKCKRDFESELDAVGVPYKRICNKCKKNATSYGRGITGKV